MEITISTELEKLIADEMKTGNYFSLDDVLREGLLTLKASRIQKKERLENLKREIQKGIDAVREGDYTTYRTDQLDEFADEIINRSLAKQQAENGAT